jgi:4-aminobutyrate aminotransferase
MLNRVSRLLPSPALVNAGPKRSAQTSASAYEKAQKLLSPVWTHGSNVIVDKAAGSWIFGTDGKKYLDFSTGIGVTNLGHCHPRIVKAAQQQVGKLIHGQANIVYHQPMLQLVQQLSSVVKLSDSDRFFFSNSGAEAIEASIKLARHATKKTNIITFEGSFHGRTIGTMSLTNSKTVYKVGYQPLMAGVTVAPFGSDHNPNALDALRDILKMQTAPEETAAIIVEPILGEGGYIPASLDFLKGLRKICDEHGILLIFDEVQSGFGRTGKMFAFEHYGVTPDILVMAKGIANGFPLSGIVSREELQKKWKPGSHGGTYGGNAVSCAAAVEVINVFKEENVLANVVERGSQLMRKLEALRLKYPDHISEVRGKGLMIGFEFKKGIAKGTASEVTNACMQHGMFLLTCSAFD